MLSSLFGVRIVRLTALACALVVPGVNASALEAWIPSDRVLEAVGLRSGTVVSLELGDVPYSAMEVTVPIAGAAVSLRLVPHSVRSGRYQLMLQGPGGTYDRVGPGPVRTLRGVVSEIPGSAVAASLLDEGLMARLELPDGRQFWIEPLAPHIAGLSGNEHVIYERGDIRPCGSSCAMAEADGLIRRFQAVAPSATGGGCGLQLCKAELACDADVEYFEAYGSVAAVENRINAVINMVNFQYERDVAITHEITVLIVRTAEPDPYDATLALDVVTEFRDQWVANHANLPRDLAHLFTGKDIDGGTIGRALAIGVVCDDDLAYAFSQSDYNGVFACATDLTAHELGHLWSAVHCSCSNHTMNSPITCANQFQPVLTIPDILAHRDSRTCLIPATDTSPPIPNPMTFASPPAAFNDSKIIMTASLAVDAVRPPVKYQFDFVSGGPGGTDSDWQESRDYMDSDLAPDTVYRYRVRSRDGAAPPNVTEYSETMSATTDHPTVCGDGVVEESEECDPPDGVTCDDDCRLIPPECVDNSDCDDFDVCTNDACQANVCVYSNNILPCVTDTCFPYAQCSGGACIQGPERVCDDGNACTDDSCHPALGCRFVDNSNSCDDGDPCTLNDVCGGGSCSGEPVTACDDGDACTSSDACLAGTCVGVEITDCDDGDPCTLDSCDPVTGCVHQAASGPCDDGNACTTGDGCQAGVCVGGSALDCDDGNPCTDDWCDPASGCRSAGNNQPCDDGSVCTVDDACDGGTCVGRLNLYGDATRDGRVDLLDILCVLDAFGGDFANCGVNHGDIADCAPDGVIDLLDVLAELDAFGGVDPCCGG